MKKKVLLIVIASFMFIGVVSAASIWGAYKGNNIIRLMVDGDPVKVADVPAISYQGRTMIPIYLLKQAGISYTWDNKNQTVNISKQKSTTTNTSFDPVNTTNKILSLGGDGVTLMKIDGEMTAVTYFKSKNGYDGDWAALDQIFVKLLDFNATFSRIIYYNGDEESLIEIRTQNYKDFINGDISGYELNKRWITSGSLFQSTGTTTNNTKSNSIVESYPELYSNDGKIYLGKLTSNQYDSDSIFNNYGTYGSEYQSKSIWNDYGVYGSEYSNESAFNKFASNPPIIVLDGKTIGYLTVNTTISNAISPIGLLKWLETSGY